MDTNLLSYLAGLTDADGSIYITLVKKIKSYRPTLSICNADHKLIFFLKSIFGGSIYVRNKDKDKWKLNYAWKVSLNKALRIIKLLLPYLKIKKAQAEIAILANGLKNSPKIESLRKKCCRLNARGEKAIKQTKIKRELCFDKDDLFYSYLAGLIDADGSISICSHGKLRQFISSVYLYSCNFLPIKILTDNFGGSFRLKKTGAARNNPNWRGCYEWRLIKKKADEFIEKLLPYLRIKKRQAKLVMKLRCLKNKHTAAFRRWNKSANDEILRNCLIIKNKCIKLNKRGKLCQI